MSGVVAQAEKSGSRLEVSRDWIAFYLIRGCMVVQHADRYCVDSSLETK